MKRFGNFKGLIRISAMLLTVVLLSFSSVTASMDDSFGSADNTQGDSDLALNIDFDSVKAKLIAEYPELSDSELCSIGENENFSFVWDDSGADIFVLDKRTDKVWSNLYSATKYGGEFYNKMFLSQLLNVKVANAKGNIDQYNLIDNDELSDFKINSNIDNGRLTLAINMHKKDIDFEISFWLDESGLTYSIPKESIKENGDNTIISITVMPSFGAAASSEDGYIFYPDGSGAVMNFHETQAANVTSYTYSFYGTDEQDLSLIEDNASQDIYNMMLPVYGIKHTSSGIFAAITEGSEDSDLVIAPSGFQVSGLYRSYFTFNYKVYAAQTINGKQSVKIVPDSIATTKTVKIFILDDTANSYSDMAALYRDYLINRNVLKRAKDSNSVPISLDFFMGITEKGMFADNYLSLTTFDEVREILDDLKSEGVDNIQVKLIAWSKGGYDNVPTISTAASQLGGNKDLRKLMEYCDGNSIDLYLNLDFVTASKDSSALNLRKDTVRDYFGNIITNEDETEYLINPVAAWDKFVKSAFKKTKLNEGTSFNFENVGKILQYAFKSGKPVSRYSVAQQYSKSLELVKEKNGKVSVSGGNMYVLPYADKIYDVPSRDSNYFNSDYFVPFYQMVVHGSVDYSSEAGNLNGDLQTQCLRWIETGSAPYFVLTQDSPETLKNTSFTELYSSEYSQWKAKIVELYKKINADFKDVWNKEIVNHLIISDDLKVIEYSDGTRVVLNYSKDSADFEGLTVDGLSYSVIKR